MKKEKLKKKFDLNKVSIAQLDKDQINEIKSGEEPQSIGLLICQSGLPTCQKIMSCTTTV